MLTVLVCYLQLTKMRLYYDPVGLISPIFPANKVLKKRTKMSNHTFVLTYNPDLSGG